MDFAPGKPSNELYHRKQNVMNHRGKLIKAANELNDKLGLDPIIKLSLSIEGLKKGLHEAGRLLLPEDDLSDETIDTLKQLGIEPPKPDDQ